MNTYKKVALLTLVVLFGPVILAAAQPPGGPQVHKRFVLIAGQSGKVTSTYWTAPLGQRIISWQVTKVTPRNLPLAGQQIGDRMLRFDHTSLGLGEPYSGAIEFDVILESIPNPPAPEK
jgi:hypothetical protein